MHTVKCPIQPMQWYAAANRHDANCQSHHQPGMLFHRHIIAKLCHSIIPQALRVLNHMGVCLSYNSTWQHLRSVTDEARFFEVVRHDHWIWVYDSLNFQQAVCHERVGWYYRKISNYSYTLFIRTLPVSEKNCSFTFSNQFVHAKIKLFFQ